MLKRHLISLVMATISLLTLNPAKVLAERAEDYVNAKTFYPNTCNINLEGENYSCDTMVFGFFRNGSANLKLCDNSNTCFILIFSASQMRKFVNDEDFYADQVAIQEGDYIRKRLDGEIVCSGNTGAINCSGNLEDSIYISIYAR